LEESVIEYKSDKKFIINMHALHNAAKIRRYLPQELTVPIPLVPDRKTHHQTISKSVRTMQTQKR
ncbi:hypothetical protein BDQ17DRAFT_1190165, partial [Cyathus striatus]